MASNAAKAAKRANASLDRELLERARKYAPEESNNEKPTKTKTIKDKKTRAKMVNALQCERDAAVDAARFERYHAHAEAGAIELERDHERTWRVEQTEILQHVDVNAKKKAFDVELAEFGPYVAVDFCENGKCLVVGGRRGHVAAMEWNRHKLQCEVALDRECVKCVKYLHNEQFFAVAQRKCCYVYDKRGIEIHRLDKHRGVEKLEFLPKHFLLASVGREGMLRFQDTTHGAIVAEHRTKLGPCRVMRKSRYNAIMHLGHDNGTVTLWSPNQGQALVKMLCHRGPLTALAIDQSGKFMATAGLDCQIKIWDLRKYEEMHAYYSPTSVMAMDISQRGQLAISYGSRVQIWNDALQTKQKSPYLNHSFVKGSKVSDVKFCPYEDVLAIGHQHGVTNILVPGSGEPNYDTFVANPFETKNQRREMEVHNLLDKLPAEMIQLDPNAIGQLREVPKEVQKGRREAALKAEMAIKKKQREKNEAKTRMKGKNKASKRYRKKQRNVIDNKRMAKLEAKAREENLKKKAATEGCAKPGAKAGAASDAPRKPDDVPEALARFYK